MIEVVVNERSTSWLLVGFLDRDGAPATPDAVSYRIDCLATGTEIQADVSVTPGEQVEITITPDQNRIIDRNHRTERKIVTVTATYGASDQATSEYRYLVRNLNNIT